MQAKCGLCQRERRGGSLASDAVVKAVSCDTFAKMDASNQFGGMFGDIKVFNAAGGKSKKTKKGLKQSKGLKKGGTACDANLPVFKTIVDPPSSSPTENLSSLSYDQVASGVIESLKAQVADGSLMQNSIAFPENWSKMQVYAPGVAPIVQGGGQPSCMC